MKENAKGVVSDQLISERESRAFYILKALAIFSVLVSHLSSIVYDYGAVARVTTFFLEPLACVGVPLFLFASGFFYRRKPKDTISFWKKKGITIVLPWIIAGALRNLFDVIISDFDNVQPFLYYVKRMVGLNSSFYFPMVLILLFVLFKFIWNRPVFLWGCLGITVLSIALEMLGFSYISMFLGTPYLNVMNWVGFFAAGALTRRYRWDRKLCEHRFWGWICLTVSLILYVWVAILETGADYFRMSSLLFESVCIIALYFVSFKLAANKMKVLVEIGSCTYCIYLYHLLIVRNFITWIDIPAVWTALQPLGGLMIMMALIVFGKWLCIKVLKIQWPMTLVGLKSN